MVHDTCTTSNAINNNKNLIRDRRVVGTKKIISIKMLSVCFGLAAMRGKVDSFTVSLFFSKDLVT